MHDNYMMKYTSNLDRYKCPTWKDSVYL